MLLLLSIRFVAAQQVLSICSWNIANLGKSKNDAEINYMAQVLARFDLVSVQEVTAGYGGAEAVARLVAALERKGADWDYRLSDPTTGSGSERYAFLWKKNRVRLLGNAWLESTMADSIVREPFLGRFVANNDTLTLIAFHAVPANDFPQREIMQLHMLDTRYKNEKLLFVGDFNLNSNEPSFRALYLRGYDDVLENVRTTIKMEPKGSEHYANAYDNMFYRPFELHLQGAGKIDITRDFPTLQDCRMISDHAPVYVQILFK